MKKTLSKGDTTNWSFNLFKITEIINDTIPSYKIDDLKKRYNESLLKKTELTMKENKDVMKNVSIDIVQLKYLFIYLYVYSSINTRIIVRNTK